MAISVDRFGRTSENSLCMGSFVRRGTENCVPRMSRFPDLSRQEPPFRPILIVAPLILLDTRTWENEMENFFHNDGVIFWPILSLHGDQLARLRRHDAQGAEVEIGAPVLDLNRIQRHKV